MLVYVIITIIVLIAIYTVVQYNNFVKLNIKIKEAFSNMDIYLKKRWDLVPNLVEIVKGYAKHEKETFKEVVALRNGSYDNMSDEEKKQNPEYKTTGGYLKVFEFKEACKNMWDSWTDDEKHRVITELPNFDADKFEQITGINVEE